MAYLQCLVGLLLLLGGAELFVRGASRLARALGMTPLVVGLTVVALGTSAPEFAVVLRAALAGETGIAVGNVVGSNIFNTFFILGVSALAAPLVAAKGFIRTDLSWMIAASGAAMALGLLHGRIGRLEGVVFCLALAAYIAWKVRSGRRGAVESALSVGPRPAFRARDAFFLVVGFVLLIPSADWIVQGATAIATGLGVSDLTIGLTVVAAGTSLPEVATSVVATLRGERDIAVGNVVGSNLFNLLGVLGLAAALSSGGVPLSEDVVWFDLPIMALAALACGPLFFTKGQISRWEGGVLAAYYAAYAACLVLASGADSGVGLSFAKNAQNAVYFTAPLIGIVLGGIVFSVWKGRKEGRPA